MGTLADKGFVNIKITAMTFGDGQKGATIRLQLVFEKGDLLEKKLAGLQRLSSGM
jgi:hypothetical protein